MNNSDSQTAESIELHDLIAFLDRSGWTREVDSQWPKSVWRRQVDDQLFSVMVPQDPSFADYSDRLTDAIRTLRRATGLDSEALLIAISSPEIDIIRVRAVRETGLLGAISLKDGTNLVSGAYNMLRSAAATVPGPRTQVTSLSASSEDLLSHALLGQTSVGSYVVNVVIPLRTDTTADELHLELQSSKDRELTQHLSQALNAAASAARTLEQTARYDAIGEAVSHGVSANLYDSLIEMLGRESSNERLQVTIEWSEGQPSQESTAIDFDRDLLLPMSEASRYLKETFDPSAEYVRGLVEDVHRAPDQEGGHVVVVRTEGRVGRKLRVVATDEQIEAAARALVDRRYVTCSGVVTRRGVFEWMHEPDFFHLEEGLLH